MVAVGAVVLLLTVVLVVLTQPLALLTVTEYVPGAVTERVVLAPEVPSTVPLLLTNV